MLEKIVMAGTGALRKKFSQAGRFFSGRVACRYSGWWMVGLAFILVLVRLGWVTDHPERREEIAAACGSAGLFYGRPQPDSQGRRIVYLQRGDTGVAVCWRDIVTGEHRVVGEQDDPWTSFMKVWPWSPDGRCFAYSTADQLVICNGLTGEGLAKLPLSTTTFTGEAKRMSSTTAACLAWLDSSSLAYLNREHHLNFVEKARDGSWRKVFEMEIPHESEMPPSSLSVVDTNAVIWAQDGSIWQMAWPQLIPYHESIANPPLSMPVTTNLVLWADASTLVDSTNGQAVATLRDLSPRENDLLAEQEPPVLHAAKDPRALNGKSTIHFQANAGIRTAKPLNITGAAPRSIFAVMRRVEGGNLSINTGGNGQTLSLRDDLRFSLIPDVNNGSVYTWIPARPAGKWDLWEFIYDGTNQISLLNGVLRGQHQIKLDTGLGSLEISGRIIPGSRHEPDSYPNGDLAELLIYDSALSATQRTQVEQYLQYKWLPQEVVAVRPPQVWFDSAAEAKINGFQQNRQTGQWLLTIGNNKLAIAEPATDGSLHPAVVMTGTLVEPSWVDDKSYACIVREERGDKLIFGGDPVVEMKRLPVSLKNVSHFSPATDGKSIVFTGIVSNQLESIWQYEFASKKLQCVVPYAERPSPYVRQINVRHGSLTLPSGYQFDYDVYPPSGYHRNDRRKYPVVIGDTAFAVGDPMYQGKPHGAVWTDALANCGAFVVVGKRPSWSAGIEHWEECVVGLRQILAAVPAVDLDRAFVFGASAETSYLNNILIRHPEWWHGVIILNPGGLPKLDKLPFGKPLPKILISYGGDEHSRDYIQRFQTNAIAQGMRVETVEHPGNAHWLVSKDAILLRTQKIVRFVFDD